MQIKGYIRLAKQPYIKSQVWRCRVILFCVQLLLECTCFQFLTIRQLPLKHIVFTILKHSILGNNSGNNNNYIYSKSLPIEANWTKVFIYYRVLQNSIPGKKWKSMTIFIDTLSLWSPLFHHKWKKNNVRASILSGKSSMCLRRLRDLPTGFVHRRMCTKHSVI